MALTRTEKRERQQVYNRRSRERKSRRAMLTAQGLTAAEGVADATVGEIVRLAAAQGDHGALRMLAIVGDVMEWSGHPAPDGLGAVIAAHDY